jgi:hypothetical protein
VLGNLLKNWDLQKRKDYRGKVMVMAMVSMIARQKAEVGLSMTPGHLWIYTGIPVGNPAGH